MPLRQPPHPHSTLTIAPPQPSGVELSTTYETTVYRQRNQAIISSFRLAPHIFYHGAAHSRKGGEMGPTRRTDRKALDAHRAR